MKENGKEISEHICKFKITTLIISRLEKKQLDWYSKKPTKYLKNLHTRKSYGCQSRKKEIKKETVRTLLFLSQLKKLQFKI